MGGPIPAVFNASLEPGAQDVIRVRRDMYVPKMRNHHGRERTLRSVLLSPDTQGDAADGPAFSWRLTTSTTVNHTSGTVIAARGEGSWYVAEAHHQLGAGRGLQHFGDAPGAYDANGERSHAFRGGAEDDATLRAQLKGQEVRVRHDSTHLVGRVVWLVC